MSSQEVIVNRLRVAAHEHDHEMGGENRGNRKSNVIENDEIRSRKAGCLSRVIGICWVGVYSLQAALGSESPPP